MKLWRSTFILLLVFLLLFTSSVFAARREGITYVALGDSIAYGTGGTDGTGYTDLLNEHFSRRFGAGEYYNVSRDGLRSEDLLGALLVPEDPYGVQIAVMQADIITISIGGNDLLGPFLEELMNVIEKKYTIYVDGIGLIIDYQALLKDFEEWEDNPMTQPHFTDMIGKLSVQLPGIIEEFSDNWYAIIGKIRSLNPEAEILVNTVYNPLKFSNNLEGFASIPITAINASIYEWAVVYDYHVVDVYTRFERYNNPRVLAVADLRTLPMYFEDPDYNGAVPLHPTDLGYHFIVNLHKGLVGR